MAFAPQRFALLRHRLAVESSKSAPNPHSVFYTSHFSLFDAEVFLHFDLLTSFSILTWTCAPRHNGVQFFTSHLASWLRTRRFSEPTFRSHKTLEKYGVSRLCYLFAYLHLLTSDFLHLLSSHFWLSPCLSFFLAVLFHLSTLSDVSLLIKLPSTRSLAPRRAPTTATTTWCSRSRRVVGSATTGGRSDAIWNCAWDTCGGNAWQQHLEARRRKLLEPTPGTKFHQTKFHQEFIQLTCRNQCVCCSW